ncbi:MAG: glycosyltransferase family 4 protein [Chloroflexota bacterium]|nr:MAG: glycosyltransferase family 4 protein [Chloroflexota bacterium]
MRVLYLSQYYPPEIGATQIRAYEMARGLVRAGHEVTIITEFPNHPTGVIPKSYRGKLFERERDDGIDVIRVWVKASPRKTFGRRVAFYVSYMIMAILAGLFLVRGRIDALYVTSPPLFVGGAGLVLNLMRRIPLFLEVRDLWPEAAVVLGELRNPRYIGWATWLEERCYKRAKRIVVTADESMNRLRERGVPAEKLVLIRNGTNVDLFKPQRERGALLREELGLQHNFVALYAGLHGLAYDFDYLLEAVAELQSVPDFHLLMVGDGPTKTATVTRADELGLVNVTFLPSQPRARIPDFFNAADVSLVPMRKPQIAGGFPVKVYDSMACAVPVIVCAEGETRAVVEESQAGLVTEPGDAAALRAAIVRLYEESALKQRLGENGRKIAVARYSRQAQASELASLLSKSVTESPGK